MPAQPLSDRDRAVLDFERAWTGQRGGKQEAIRATFGFSAARYYQLLAELVRSDAAMAHDPLLVRRLRRRRLERRRRAAVTGLAAQGDRGLTK